MLLHEICLESLATRPDKPAVAWDTGSLSYRELAHVAERLAARWVADGLRHGDRVALWLPNCPEALVAYLACFRAGLIATALDFRYRPDEAAYCLDRSGAAALVTLAGALERLRHECPGIQVSRTLCVDGTPWLDVERAAPPLACPAPPDTVDCLSTMFFTSGTTSRPKGVTHSSRRTVSRIDKFVEEAALDANSVSLVPISLMKPLAFQLLAMAVLRAGGTARLLRQFSPDAFWAAYLRAPSPTLLALTPNLLDAVLKHPRAGAVRDCARAIWLVGGDRTPPALHTAFEAVAGYELVELCGMTETGPYAMNPPFGGKRVGSVGVPPIGVALRLVDGQEQDVPPGAIGHVVVRTPDTMIGYWNDTLASFEVLRDGWMRTGDLARADEEGFLWLEGRLKDVIVRDGSNVAPAEVETAATADPEVTGAAAVGVPDPPHGETVHLFVTAPDADARALEERLRQRLEASLRPLAVPAAVHVLSQLPLNAAGKVDKAALRALARAPSAERDADD